MIESPHYLASMETEGAWDDDAMDLLLIDYDYEDLQKERDKIIHEFKVAFIFLLVLF